ncbi:galactokinase [Parerythrobacter lacustris]|uniref:Galactokinase n=1 Tax=Parerythrobacter lacustris TaxID=2969984 RepID=A0ABT1XV84_9SPHN|nr:galactokinase [Parerythrobacter lacustris]MCR2834347.1 galactokinase [Parerythrobacter lacustris]
MARFAEVFGGGPEGVVFAPGRVNLIGDHVDYNDGLVLPMPLEVGTAVAWRARDDDRVVVHAADMDDPYCAFDLADPPPRSAGWHSLAHGMVSLMQAEFPLTGGIEMLVSGDLPRGSGLSSSASFCVAVGRAVAASSGRTDVDPVRIARLAQQVEHRFAGVACGIMDQMAVAVGNPGNAMLLDCRDLSWRDVAVPQDWCVMIVQSGVTRELVDGAYNARREQCESAARKLGVASLRDVDPDTVDWTGLDPVETRRARHVVSEIRRTRLAAKAMATGDIESFGRLMRAAHVSMRDDFEASHPEVDRQVIQIDRIIGPRGGARITGGGFGGASVAVCLAEEADRVIQEIRQEHGPDGAGLEVMRAVH